MTWLIKFYQNVKYMHRSIIHNTPIALQVNNEKEDTGIDGTDVFKRAVENQPFSNT